MRTWRRGPGQPGTVRGGSDPAGSAAALPVHRFGTALVFKKKKIFFLKIKSFLILKVSLHCVKKRNCCKIEYQIKPGERNSSLWQ